jgi:excisionase family DNA binding protein
VSDTPTQPDQTTTGATDLETLVGEWLTVPDAAERLGVPLSRVRQMVADREVLAARIGERKVTAIPAKFVDETGPRPELRGTFTVLADGGMDDAEIIEWLFTPDATLPVEGAPIDALRAGHKTEIRRRAQELAF